MIAFQHTEIQCLTAIAQHLGIDADPALLVEGYALSNEEPSFAILHQMARNIGLRTEQERITWNSLFLPKRAFPIMARLNNGNGVIVVGVQEDKAAILDPLSSSSTWILLNREQFCTRWEGEVVHFQLVNTKSIFKENIMIHRETIESQHELTEIMAGYGLASIELPMTINFPISVQELFQVLSTISSESQLGVKIAEMLNVVVHNANLYSENAQSIYDIKSWPNKSEGGNGRQLSTELFLSQPAQLITKKTPIVSMGSCFAVEIAKWLQANNYNYLVTESNLAKDGFHSSSCRWGVIFNTPGFYQTISRAFNNDMPRILQKTGGKYRDIFREEIIYSEEELSNYDKDYEQHVLCSRKALLECKVLILTVGLNEVFRHLPTQKYLHRNPWNLNPFLWKEKVLSVEENVDFLKKGIELLRKENKNVEILISVSPVPLLRSFRQGHVAVNSFHSKAILRCAVEEVCKQFEGVHYMPSFETVMYHGAMDPWQEDERHVNAAVISKIMKLFEFQFCGDLQVEINKSRYLEGRAVQEFIHSLPADLRNNPEMKVRFESHAGRLLNFPLKENAAVDQAYLILRKQYAIFGDVIDNAIANKISKTFPLNELQTNLFQSIFSYTESNVEAAVKDVSESGYHFPSFKLSAQQIAEILQHFEVNEIPGFALKFPVQIINNPFSLDLFMDKYFVEVAARCLNTIPIFESVVGFDTTAGQFSEEKQAEYAMKFHFDKDNISWINVFIYLDDVTEENGPHCYVPGSHKNRSGSLLRDGRFSDEEIIQHYGADAIKTITGEAGTMFIANTHCLHRGSIVNAGKRRILQFRYTNSMFGANYMQYEMMSLDEADVTRLEPKIKGNPRMFQNFKFVSAA